MKYTRKQLSEIVGIPDRRVLFYSEAGMLPCVRLQSGRGNAREYTDHDAHILLIIKRLSKIGFELRKINEIIEKPKI